MGIGSWHKTKGQIWLHRGPQHGVIGAARWQQKIYEPFLTKIFATMSISFVWVQLLLIFRGQVRPGGLGHGHGHFGLQGD
jgi:hypothetical protein